jgi:membrane associated rhomboid family serine protease
MIPIRDDNPTRTTPVVNYALIAANLAAFVYEWMLIQRDGSNAVVAGYGLVATRIVADPLGEAFTVLTSMFMHSGIQHLGGNMLFLYIFGDNVEDALGHGRYIGFYGLCGVIAAAAQLITGGLGSPVPMVGASGAISGVLGAYIVLYPRAPILMFNFSIPLLWFIYGFFMSFPAWLVIGFWFLVSNLMPAVATLGMRDVGGVALFAHIGGFLGGLLLVKPLLKKRAGRETFEWAGWRPPPKKTRPISRSRYERWRDRAS